MVVQQAYHPPHQPLTQRPLSFKTPITLLCLRRWERGRSALFGPLLSEIWSKDDNKYFLRIVQFCQKLVGLCCVFVRSVPSLLFLFLMNKDLLVRMEMNGRVLRMKIIRQKLFCKFAVKVIFWGFSFLLRTQGNQPICFVLSSLYRSNALQCTVEAITQLCDKKYVL